MPSQLRSPHTIEDLFLFRMSRILATSGTTIIRLCEGRLGITWREWRLIASLGPDVALLSSELAAKTQLDHARTSKAVTSLVAKKYLARIPVPGDKRRVKISLTPEGQQLLSEFFPVVAAINAALVQGLTEAELAILDKALLNAQSQAEAVAEREELPKANRRRGRKG